jgi:DNA adenine methylase
VEISTERTRRASPEDRPAARPFLKWAGGKWRLAPQIVGLLPHDLERRTYREPFLGGGAVFFYLAAERPPQRAVLSDALADLIATYKVVRRHTRALVERLEALREAHSTESYYAIRERFNQERGAAPLDRASWLIYLNKTCFNGLFRTNREGVFNVPVGRFKNPRIVDPARMAAVARALTKVDLVHRRFDHLDEAAERGDVIYLDPPYVPLSKTASFASYADGAFGADDQERLAALFRRLDQRGCLLALSNSDTPEVRRLYKGFDQQPIVAPRVISSKTSDRRPVGELLVRNLRRY